MAGSNRARAFRVVRENPGSTVADVAESLDVDHSTASYHLRRLERDRRVVADQVGRVRSHVVNGAGYCPFLRRALPRLRAEAAEPVLRALVERPVLRVADVAGAEVEAGQARWALEQLKAAGLAEKAGHGRYRLPPGREEAARRALRGRPCPGDETCPARRRAAS